MTLAAIAPRADAARRNRAVVNPLGTWNCVIYGHPAFGDERVLLNFGVGGSSQVARQEGDEIGEWSPLSFWTADDDDLLTFTDPRSGRRFEADLSRGTLGGSWRTYTLLGGWWCSAADFGPLPTIEKQKSMDYMPPLLPALTATPSYPVQAIRDAKQGRAVSCFFVDANGYIVRPELIELSDEVFRQPILSALARSRYQGWNDERVLRPGCRSFIFKLDQIDATAAE
jgi:hypothetical protein